jgi:chorismate synthase
MPAGLQIDLDRVNEELRRRQQGYGRGARQKIETDTADIVGGVRHGVTTGAPIAILVKNRDWDNWRHVMSITAVDFEATEVREQITKKAITRFRPGHADLAGTLKFRQKDIRDVLERASARETAARVAVGAVCQELLRAAGVSMLSHVIEVGGIASGADNSDTKLAELEKKVLESEMFCADVEATERMKETIKAAWREGDSLGGVVEVLADNLPVGLGSYTQWDEKIDGQIAQCVMSIQAIKAVEIGDGVESTRKPGSQVHDALYEADETRGARLIPTMEADTVNGNGLPFTRKTNHAGGIEGGMTNGSRLRVRAYMKPIPTIRKGLPSLAYPSFEAETAHYERSDVCAVPAASVVVKAMVAFALARALLSKFGGDTVADTTKAIEEYRAYCKSSGAPGACMAKPAETPEMELE